MASRQSFRRRFPCCLLAALLCCWESGCNGKSIKVENPVFAPPPPRRSLVNASADVEESRLTQSSETGDIRQTTFAESASASLSGTTVVARVNGQAVFLDDVVGTYRRMLAQHEEISEAERQLKLKEALQQKLPEHVDQEIVLYALNAKVPEDRRKLIRESMEPKFQELLENIQQKKGLKSEEELNEMLSRDGMSVDNLRDMFMRTQMVNGYVATIANAPKTIDRQELVTYYQDHISEYTPAEKIRYSEIVVRFAEHGGRKDAEKLMANVVTQLKNGRDFGETAAAFSDNLSAEKNGDLGWLDRGAISDKELEEMLFSLPVGGMSKVLVRDDRFELYYVARHTEAHAIPFQDVQKEIEQQLLTEKAEKARAQVLKDLKSRSTVTTIFDRA
jgi:parvulin-like peptidyl-prolyl isomerase